MVNQLKIITMTRLALYDKHEGPADRAANDYFRHDYIYRNNLGTRLAVGFGGIIILGIYWIRTFFLNQMDIFELDFQQIITDSLLFILAILAVYSLIGTIQGTRQYYLVQKRLAQYQALVRQLERLDERTHRAADEDKVIKRHQPDENMSSQLMYSPPVRTTASSNTRPQNRPIRPPVNPTRQIRAPQNTIPEHTRPRPRASRGASLEHTRVPMRPRDTK